MIGETPHCQMRIVEGIAAFHLGDRILDLGVDLGAKAALLGQLQDAVDDPTVNALLMTCATGAFSALEYRRFLRRLDDPSGDRSRRDLLAAREEHALDQLILAIDSCPKLTVIGLQGHVAGPFVGLSLAFDLRLAAPSAVLDFASVDGVPGGGGVGFFLPQCLGLCQARDLILRGTRLPANQAALLGLVSDVLSGTVAEKAFVAACIQETRGAVRRAGGISARTDLVRPYTRLQLQRHLEREGGFLRQTWERHAPVIAADPELVG